jgi:hypothetical protein
MHPISVRLAAITEDRRASYLFDTKTAAEAVGCVPTKFNDWWQRSRRKLIDLYLAQPGELAAELATLIAEAEMLRQQQTEKLRLSPP